MADEFVDEFMEITTEEPVVTEPVVTEPIITEPVVTEPIITEPIIMEPIITEPVVTEPVVTEPVVNYEELYKKEQQRNRSWEGRLSATERRNRALEAQIETDAKKEITINTLVDVSDPLIAGFVKEMGDDFIKPLDAYINKKLDLVLGSVKPLLDKLPEIQRRVEIQDNNKVEEHNSSILEVHPDTPELIKSGELEAYTDSLPYKEALICKQIIAKGTTKQVINFLNEFKESKKQTKPVVQKTSQSKIDAATVVKGGSATLPKSKAAIDDFEGSFNEAIGLN